MQIIRTSAAAAALALTLVTPAASAVVWKVEGVFSTPGQVPSRVAFSGAASKAWSVPAGGLHGVFTTEGEGTDMRVVDVDLTTTAHGAFRGFTYDDVAKIDMDQTPQFFRLHVPIPGEGVYELQLFFSALLDPSSKSPIAFSGYEHQDFPGSGNRVLSGFATATESVVPEPGTWALMIAGFGMAGVVLRRRSSPSLA